LPLTVVRFRVRVLTLRMPPPKAAVLPVTAESLRVAWPSLNSPPPPPPATLPMSRLWFRVRVP
jgi:hypothetical protein